MDYPDRDQPEPGEISFNGELATPEELERLENLASSFLEAETPVVHHTYGYMNSDLTAGIMFTLEQADTIEQQFSATITANAGDLDDPFFVFSVDQDNTIIVNFLHPEQDYGGLVRVLQLIKGEETLDESERALLDHLESFTLNAEFVPSVGEEVSRQFWPADPTEERVQLAGFLRQMILSHTSVGLRVHEANPLPNDQVMVLKHDFVGVADEEEIEDLPRFQIVIIDPDNDQQYCFTTDFFGTKALYVDDTRGLGGIDEDDDIEAFADVLGLYAPGKGDVARMLELLNRAWMDTNGLTVDK